MGKNEYGRVEIYGWTGGGRVKNEGAIKVFQNHRNGYTLKVNVNAVICVFVAHFRSPGTFESL